MDVSRQMPERNPGEPSPTEACRDENNSADDEETLHGGNQAVCKRNVADLSRVTLPEAARQRHVGIDPIIDTRVPSIIPKPSGRPTETSSIPRRTCLQLNGVPSIQSARELGTLGA